MKKVWKKWLKITKKVVNVQANILLSLFYAVFIIPFSIFLKMFFKNALLGHRYAKRKNTYWVKKKNVKHDLKFAQEQ